MIIRSVRMSTAVLYEIEMFPPLTSMGFEHMPDRLAAASWHTEQGEFTKLEVGTWWMTSVRTCYPIADVCQCTKYHDCPPPSSIFWQAVEESIKEGKEAGLDTPQHCPE